MYKRPGGIKARLSSASDAIIAVPKHLKPIQNTKYPEDNFITFERWYLENFNASNKTNRLYLPIQWTALYCNNQYGSKLIVKQIQQYIDQLDKSKKYYTIVQYDDGILNDISELDIKVCAMSGSGIDYALPLLCNKHSYKFPNIKKDIFASFVCNLTHPIRVKMYNELYLRPGFYVIDGGLSLHDYCEILARSKYVLCPRGYGQNSFRIQEAIDYGAIPIYISDDFIFPYGMHAFPWGHYLSPDRDIEQSLRLLDETKADDIIIRCIEKFKHLFTYQGCKQMILTHIRNEANNNSSLP